MGNEQRTTIEQQAVDFAGGHLRVLGPPGSGKTALLAARYRRLETERPGAVAVLTFSRQSREALAAEIIPSGSASFGPVRVYSYHGLACRVLEAAGLDSARVIDEMEDAILLAQVIREMARSRQGNAKLQSDYRNVAESSAFREAVLGVVHTLAQHGITEAHRDALIAAGQSERVADLVTIYLAYRRELESRGLCTYYDVAWRAADVAAKLPTDRDPLVGIEALLIDDFQDVDPGQYALIRALAPPGGRRNLNVFGDPTGARFRERGTTDRYLMEVFPREYRPADFRLPAVCGNDEVLGTVMDALLRETTGPDADAHALAAGIHSGEERAMPAANGDPNSPPQLFGPGPTPEAPVGDEVEVTLGVAADEVAEAAHVAEEVAALLQSGRYRPGDIAIAAREKRDYESVLAHAFRARGLLLDTGRRGQHPLSYFVVSLLRILADAGSESARYALAASPYLVALQEIGEKVSLPTPANEDVPATPRAEDTVSAVDIDAIREEIIRKATRHGTFDLMEALRAWVRPFLEETGEKELPEEVLAFLTRLSEEWRMYEDLRGREGRGSSVSRLSQFLSFSRAASGNERGNAPAGNRVGFYSCRELTSRRFPAVFVVGCSENLFPALPPREAYIPYGRLEAALRDVLPDRPVELHAARASDLLLRDEYALMLSTLTRARERLFLTAPEQHRGISTPAPSRVLRAIPEEAVIRSVGRSAAPFLRYAAALARSAAPPAGTAETRDHPEIEEKTGLRVGDLWRRRAPEPRFTAPEKKALSPSAIQLYRICPRKYFYTRVLRIREAETAAMTFGTMFHALMKTLADECRTHEALKAFVESERLDAAIDTVVQEELANSTAFAGAGDVFRRAAREHLKSLAERVVELDASRTDAYRIERAEESLAFEHEGRSFGGRADRIDRSADGRRVVIDYKTGAIDKTGKSIRKKALAGFEPPEDRLWQVPMYCRGARDTESPPGSPGASGTPHGPDAQGAQRAGEPYPALFCYYVVQPEGDSFVAGVAVRGVGDGESEGGAAGVFDESFSRRFSYLTPEEIEESLDEAAAIADEIFSERAEYERTSDRTRCRQCDFQRVCERTV